MPLKNDVSVPAFLQFFGHENNQKRIFKETESSPRLRQYISISNVELILHL
jgi:hypothetical protein